MHQHQACPRWVLTGVLLLVGFLITAGTLAAQTIPEKTLTNSMGMEFVLIPSGTFKMGSDTGDADERPVHQVTISKAFYMGKYEVTQGQWQAIMANNPSASPGDANRPVDQVAWNDVQTFLSKLNAMEGGQQYRLPTEAEWEYAARAGSTTIFSFGNDPKQLGEYAWYRGNAQRHPHPVGQKRPNAWGLYDMLGNVWEWVPGLGRQVCHRTRNGSKRARHGYLSHASGLRLEQRDQCLPGGEPLFSRWLPRRLPRLPGGARDPLVLRAGMAPAQRAGQLAVRST